MPAGVDDLRAGPDHTAAISAFAPDGHDPVAADRHGLGDRSRASRVITRGVADDLVGRDSTGRRFTETSGIATVSARMRLEDADGISALGLSDSCVYPSSSTFRPGTMWKSRIRARHRAHHGPVRWRRSVLEEPIRRTEVRARI